MMQFQNKTVIVTGSTKGIGKTIALEFLMRGAQVVINGRDQERLNKATDFFTSQGFEPLPVAGDVTDPVFCKELVNKTIDKFGKLNYLINNAGLPMRGRFDEMTPEFFKLVVDVNLMSAVYCSQAAYQEIIKNKGSIIFISSLAGMIGMPNSSPYCAAKMALTGLAQSMRIELSGTGAHVGIVRVGLVNTNPDKRVLTHNGSSIPVTRKGHESEQDVAKAVFRLIRKRRFMITQTPVGTALRIVNTIAPWLVYKYLAHGQFSDKYK